MTRLKYGYGCHKRNIQIVDINNHITAKIGIGQNQTTLISLCDIEILQEHGFYAHQRKDGKYVARSNKNGAYLHRLLMNPDDEQEIDHVDAEPLNNTRGNLRRCTKRQNNLAKKIPKLKGYSGIHKNKWGKYQAFDGDGKKQGKYDSAHKAAKARDELMLDAYFHSHSGEELHTYSFIDWNFESPEQASESDDFLFDEVQEAQWLSFQTLQEKGWNCN
ncbi:HNH endonuclease [Vibrio splendidus]|uniref:HNH endonuclease n=1 Tax=Vibrio splendidus TaxID=29497 RepID=UPI000C841BD4|nr:HNH endonuclease [Vibrio splendidus]PMI72790.1 numod4 motif family protein [Vibrio splendidus]